MKKLFERDGFVFAGLRGKQKKHDLCVTAAVLLFFVLSAYTFMNALYCLSDIIGSVVGGSADIAGRDALRTLPIFLTFLMSLAGLMAAHSFYRNESGAVLRKRARTLAAVGMGLGALLILYVAAGLLAGRYLSVAEGAPTPLYPLDTVLYALAVCGAGVLVFLYFGKNTSAAPFAGPCRAPEKKKKSAGRRVGAALWLLLGLYGFSGFFYSLFIVDLSDGYVPYSLALMLVLLITWLSVAVWDFYYNNLTARKQREALLPLALISLCVSAAAALLYFPALKNNLDGPANVGFGILPIAFAANVNIATLIVVAAPLIVSVTALIKGIRRAGDPAA